MQLYFAVQPLLDGGTFQLQNGGRPCDIAQSYTSSGVEVSPIAACNAVKYHLGTKIQETASR